MKRSEKFREILAKQKEKTIKELEQMFLSFEMILDAFDQEHIQKKIEKAKREKISEI